MASTVDLDLDYSKYDFKDPEVYAFKSGKGLTRQVAEELSAMKNEPEWMLKKRLKALEHFERRPMPTWGGDLSTLNFDDIHYYVRPSDEKADNWDEVPENIRRTYEKFGVMIDTHTADGLKVAQEHHAADMPTLVLETALPAKFEDTIIEALGRKPQRPPAMEDIERLPQRVQVMDVDVEAVKRFIAEKTGGR